MTRQSKTSKKSSTETCTKFFTQVVNNRDNQRLIVNLETGFRYLEIKPKGNHPSMTQFIPPTGRAFFVKTPIEEIAQVLNIELPVAALPTPPEESTPVEENVEDQPNDLIDTSEVEDLDE